MTHEDFDKLTELVNEHRRILRNAVAEKVSPENATIQRIEVYADGQRFELYAEDLKDETFVASLRDRKSTRLNSSHTRLSRMPSSA